MDASPALVLTSLVVAASLSWCEPEPELPAGGTSACPTCWRSSLYPEDWTPDYTDGQGRFLHDFSYAGYRGGVMPLPAVDGPMFSVLERGADPTGAQDSTKAIQDTIDAAGIAGGGVVYLPRGLYRCDGLLAVTASGVILRGDGPEATRLVFTKVAGMSGRAHLEFRGALRLSGERPLAMDGESRSTQIRLADTAGLAPGQELAIGWTITDAFVSDHGMEGTWVTFNGQWKSFFSREIVDVTGDTVELDVPLRYAALRRDGASVKLEQGYLSECGVEELSLSNAADSVEAWAEHRVHVLALRGVKDCFVRRVKSFPSPFAEDGRHLQNGGIYILDSKRVTVADCVMERAQNRGEGGDGYLFELSRSDEILVRDCVARAGRHGFIQNWDFGTSGCVFLRTTSEDGRAFFDRLDPIGQLGCSEFHHSLAMANLIDDSTVDDCWGAVNRNDYSSGAGHSATESVFWRMQGAGRVDSFQAGLGYVIGAGEDVNVRTDLDILDPISHRARATAPEDFTEGLGAGKRLLPRSLYDDQLLRRLAR